MPASPSPSSLRPTDPDDRSGGPRLQPLLYPQARRARPAPWKEPVLAQRGPGALRARASRRAARPRRSATTLGLDPGYLSRIVQNFDEKGLITRRPLPADRRQYQLSLTAKGRQTFAKLNLGSAGRGRQRCWLGFRPSDATRLHRRRWRPSRPCWSNAERRPAAFMLREPSPRRHGLGGLAEQGAAYAARLQLGHRLRGAGRRDRARSSSGTTMPRASTAGSRTVDGEPVGSVFLVKATDDDRQAAPVAGGAGSARARASASALVEPNASPCARELGYGRMTLWTQSILIAARSIYQDAGLQAGRDRAASQLWCRT